MESQRPGDYPGQWGRDGEPAESGRMSQVSETAEAAGVS